MYGSVTGLQIGSLDDLPEIRPFPEIANRILRAWDDPSTTANDLCELIRCDSAISLKIMRIANSSAYGFGGRVKTIKRAVVVLGFRTLRNLALSVATGDVFTSEGDAKIHFDRLWEQSIACAAVASRMAKLTDIVPPEEAFLSGIVHDVGKLMFFDIAADAYHQATEKVSPRSIVQVENELFGINHQELGLRCADEWGLPYEIAEAIGAHHFAFEENDHPELGNLIGLAESLSRLWGVGVEESSSDELEDLLNECVLSFDVERVKPIEDTIHEEFNSLRSAFVG